MKTAPRNGAAFLACQNLDDETSKMAVCYISIDGTLCFDATGAIVDTDEFHPRHWMPLPESP